MTAVPVVRSVCGLMSPTAALAAWLRKILAGTLADALRALHRAKRDVSRERSLEAELDQSSDRLQAWLAAEQTSPSEHADRNRERAQQPERGGRERHRVSRILTHRHRGKPYHPIGRDRLPARAPSSRRRLARASSPR